MFKFTIWLVSLLKLASSATGDGIASSPVVTRTGQGVTSASNPTFYTLSGFNGLQLPLSLPNQSVFDYTVMFWFRSALNQQELMTDRTSKHYLFELDGSVQCFIQGGTSISCTPSLNSTVPIKLNWIPDIQQWLHFTYIANSLANYSTLRVTYPGGYTEMTLAYSSISSGQAYLGINSGLTKGVAGDVRDFYMSAGAIDGTKIGNLMNMVKVFDLSIMAYYRFMPEFGELNDFMRSQQAMLVTAAIPSKSATDQSSLEDLLLYTQPKLGVEAITQPFCNCLENQLTSVARFNGLQSGRVQITQAVFDQSIFSYTLSMWVHSLGQSSFSTNSRQGLENSSFFQLDGSFALWFDSASTFKVQVFAKNDVNTMTTSSVFLPLNQWVNIQVNVDSKTGITVMTFNTNGELQQTITKAGQLSQQVPLGTFSAFQNFKGYALDLILWNQFAINLPWQTSAINYLKKNTQTSVSRLVDGAILNYNFNQTNFSGSGFTSLALDQPRINKLKNVANSINSLNVTQSFNITLNTTAMPTTLPTSSQPQMSAPIGAGLIFEQILVPFPDQVNFTSPSNLGQLSANSTLFDGLGCPDPKLNQFLLKGSPAFVQMSLVQPKTKSLTVEFWFRFPTDAVDMPVPNVLFAMDLRLVNNTYAPAMNIYIDIDGLLKCAPFGMGSAPETILIYEGITPQSISAWQHVSCSYDQQTTVSGEHLALNSDSALNLDVNELKQTLLPSVFVLSLASIDQRLASYVRETQVNIVLGSNSMRSQNQNCFFKDLRIWTSKRDSFELFEGRFRQMPLSSDLLVNLKFMNGNANVRNEAELNSTSATVVGGTYVQSDGQNVVCASDRYFLPNVGMCTTLPFDPNIQVAFSAVNDAEHGHQLLITPKYSLSSTVLPGFQPQFQNYWSSSNTSVDKLFAQKRAAEVQILDPNLVVDGTSYQFNLTTIDPVSHNWWQTTTQTFTPRKCFYVADVATGSPFGEINYAKQALQNNTMYANAINAQQASSVQSAQTDLCFKFQVKQVDGCTEDNFDSPSNKVSIRTQPVISASVLANAVTGFDHNKKVFDVCFDQSTVNSAFPANIPINFMFDVTWQKPGSLTKATMGLVYRVTVTDPINIKLVASATNVPAETSVILDGSNSIFADGAKKGMMFRWKCPNGFQNYCDKWSGSPVLEITPKAFRILSGAASDPQIFSLQAWSILAGPNPLPTQVFTQPQTLVWKPSQIPEFTLTFPTSNSQTLPVFLVTQPNQIKVSFKNQRGNDANLQYTWTLIPPDHVDTNRTRISADQSVFYMEANTLQFGTSYSVKVEIKNSNVSGQSSIQVMEFSTQQAPSQGYVSISPSQGNMLSTNFTVSLTGYLTSNSPLQYSIWGVLSTNPIKRINLSAGFQLFDAKGSAKSTLILPAVQSIQIDVMDQTGEVITTQASVLINQAAKTNWTDVAFRASQLAVGVTSLTNNQAVSFQIGQDASLGKLTLTEANAALSVMTKWFGKASQLVSLSNDLRQAALIANAISLLTANQDLLTNVTIHDVEQILTDLLENTQVADTLAKNDKIFSQNIVSTLNNLLCALRKSGDQQTQAILTNRSSLLLQSSTQLSQVNSLGLMKVRAQITKAMSLRNNYLDIMCRTSSMLEARVSVPGLELIVSNFAADSSFAGQSTQFLFSQDQTTVVVPVGKVIEQTLDYDPLAGSVCLQVTFMETSPLASYSFLGQSSEHNVFVQTSSIDNRGNRILSDQNGIMDLQLSPYEVKFPFNFTSSDFHRNQTVCMVFDSSLQIVGDARWTTSSCISQLNDKPTGEQIPTLTCICNILSNQYIGVITDESRLIEYLPPYRLLYEVRLLAVLVPLVMLGMCLPCLAIRWDREDLTILEDDPFSKQLSDEFVEAFRQVRDMYAEEVLYKLPQLEIYRGMKEQDFRAWSLQTIWMFAKQQHPVLSLWFQFDFFSKRLFRLAVVIWQVSLITIGLLACSTRQAENSEMLQSWGDQKLIRLGFLFSLLTLPPPGWFYEFFKISVESTSFAEIDHAQSKQGDVILNDAYMYLKLIFIFASALVYAIAITLVSLFVWYSRTDLSTMQNLTLAGYLQSFKMTDEQLYNFIGQWYLAVLAFGWILLNGARVFVISLLAPSESRAKIDSEFAQLQSAQQQTGLLWCTCGLLRGLWWLLTCPCMLLLKCLTCFDHYGRCLGCNCKGFMYLAEYTWKTGLFVPKESVEAGVDLLLTLRLLSSVSNSKLMLQTPGNQTLHLETSMRGVLKREDIRVEKEMRLESERQAKELRRRASLDEEQPATNQKLQPYRDSSPEAVDSPPKRDKSEKKPKKEKKSKKRKSKKKARDDESD